MKKNRLVNIFINDMNKLMGTEVSVGDMPGLRDYVTSVLELAIYMSMQKPPMEFDFKEKMIADLNNKKELTPASLQAPPYSCDLFWGTSFEKDGSLFDPLIVFPAIKHNTKLMLKSRLYGGREIKSDFSDKMDEKTTTTDDELSKTDDLSNTTMKVTKRFTTRTITDELDHAYSNSWADAKLWIDDLLEKSSPSAPIAEAKKFKALTSVFNKEFTDRIVTGSKLYHEWYNRAVDLIVKNQFGGSKDHVEAGEYMKKRHTGFDAVLERRYSDSIAAINHILETDFVPVFPEYTKKTVPAREVVDQQKLIKDVVAEMNKNLGAKLFSADDPVISKYVTHVLSLSLHMSRLTPPMKFDFQKDLLESIASGKEKIRANASRIYNVQWNSDVDKNGVMKKPVVVFPAVTHGKDLVSKVNIYGAK